MASPFPFSPPQETANSLFLVCTACTESCALLQLLLLMVPVALYISVLECKQDRVPNFDVDWRVWVLLHGVQLLAQGWAVFLQKFNTRETTL